MLSCNYNNILHKIISVLKGCVDLNHIDRYASFASLGITSLRAVELILDINATFAIHLKSHDLFSYSTPDALASYIVAKLTDVEALSEINSLTQRNHQHHEPIAIIAIDCKYPGADDCETFWQNCVAAKESITFFDKDTSQNRNENSTSYNVYARGILNAIEYFDANFFNYSPKEAHLSDPQHRLFIESAWKALEKSGYASNNKDHGKVGVYASMNDSTYILDQSALQATQDNLTERFALQRLMSSQFLATKVAYLLNCTGPSITVQTACSSSLVAVVLACQQLTAFACDMAIAGGVSIVTPQDRPYVYQQNNIYSPDGHCRPFDSNAQGTVFSNGLGVVVLKRLSDAIRDRDFIVSVIKGYALNNDGNHKMSYTAPAMQGQLECILSAHAMAKIEVNSIQYLEAHGTGTLIGDPIEIDALTKAFRHTSSKEQFCAIGSIKANIGHTHVAAGIAGLIKVALALKNQKIPPALHFKTANSDIDFKHTPFYVNTRLLHWRKTQCPRRAAVSAFGVGGTNAHIILEEAPIIKQYPTKRSVYLLLFSAKSEVALQEYCTQYIDFLETQYVCSDQFISLADLAYTLQVGRNHYPCRFGIVCESSSDALNQLKIQKNRFENNCFNTNSGYQRREIVFLFPGQGTQYVNMSRELYKLEPFYRKILDECLQISSKYMDVDLYDILFPKKSNVDVAQVKLLQTQFIHPILFSIEYSLARLLQYWGIEPDAMLGHSLGEYVAACLADVFSLENAIYIICARGNAIACCSEGAMLSVALARDVLQPFCTEEVAIAVESAPNSCVLSGSPDGVQAVKQRLKTVFSTQPLAIKQLTNASPFHTHLLAAAVEPFLKALQSVVRQAPKIPYLSNLTGDWVTEADVLNDQYWIDHMLNTVQLSQCIEKLLDRIDNTIFVEVGSGRTLLSSMQMHTQSIIKATNILPNMISVNKHNDSNAILNALKGLWCYGCTINWQKFYAHEKRSRIPLPTYPFQKQRFWIDSIFSDQLRMPSVANTKSDLTFYSPTWICNPEIMELSPALPSRTVKCRWIIFANQSAVCEQICQTLTMSGEDIVKIFQKQHKIICSSKDYIINPKEKSEYDDVFGEIKINELMYYNIIHFWGVECLAIFDQEDLLDSDTLYLSLYSGVFIYQALSKVMPHAKISWSMVTSHVHSVIGDEEINPLKSTVLSLCRVLPLENSNFHMNHIDVDLIADIDALIYYSDVIIDRTMKGLFNEKMNDNAQIVALRHNKCWVPFYHQVKFTDHTASQSIMPIDHGVYLITGGLGGMGLTLTQWLCAKNTNITVVLLSRTDFPEQISWNEWVASHNPENSISNKIKLLQQIISTGCRVEIFQVDIAHFQKMKKIISIVENQIGAIRGIFHLAGIPGKGLAALKSIDGIRTVLRPKLQGTYVLVKLFRKKELDFFIAASSLTAIVGGVGQIDYCAANIFLDNFLRKNLLKNCRRLLTINWNAWRSVGMATNVGHVHCRLYAGNSVTPEQGVAVLQQLFSAPYTQIVVTRYSPEEEIMRIKETFRYSQPERNQLIDEKIKSLGIYDVVKHAWEKVLGVTEVSKEVTFYDYGGDSLTLVQLIIILEQYIGIKIMLRDLMQHLTLDAMTSFVKQSLVKTG